MSSSRISKWIIIALAFLKDIIAESSAYKAAIHLSRRRSLILLWFLIYQYFVIRELSPSSLDIQNIWHLSLETISLQMKAWQHALWFSVFNCRRQKNQSSSLILSCFIQQGKKWTGQEPKFGPQKMQMRVFTNTFWRQNQSKQAGKQWEFFQAWVCYYLIQK